MDSLGISRLNTKTGKSLANAAFSTIFIANVVLPIDGRAAIITKSAFCKPEVMLSKSVKPVDKPVTPPFVFWICSIRSIVDFRMSSTLLGPSPLVSRDSAIAKTFRSAKSNSSAKPLPCGLKLASAISFDAEIS